MKGFVIAAPHSGSGKTTVTLALMAAFTRRGLSVQPFKTGPDYIDAGHHAGACGKKSQNLDTWMMGPENCRKIFARHADGADLAVVEGVMGLFDGVDGRREEGSTAHLAKTLGLPVILLIDARSMAKSVAALAQGFVNFDKNLSFAGIILNKTGSENHRRILTEAIEAAGLPPVLGAFGREPSATIPERHLGLLTSEDASFSPEFFQDLANLAEKSVDIGLLLSSLAETPLDKADEKPAPFKKKIAVARDRAFCFYYEENLKILENCGAKLLFFSPIAGENVPEGAEALYLGGGYPELYAKEISANKKFLETVRQMSAEGLPVYAECGGFMTLCREVEDMEGKSYEMAGVFPAEAKMGQKAFRLGYREVEIEGGNGALRARGHEFHYSSIGEMPEEIERGYKLWNARGEALAPEGYRVKKTIAGYIHLHFGSNPAFAKEIFGL